MLSILIPVYNYAVFPLVLEVHKQCIAAGIPFSSASVEALRRTALVGLVVLIMHPPARSGLLRGIRGRHG